MPINGHTFLVHNSAIFGQFKSDIEFAEHLNEVYDRYNYPSSIFASSAKNNQDNLLSISKVLKNTAMPLWMSVQSMTEDVLENIKRKIKSF